MLVFMERDSDTPSGTTRSRDPRKRPSAHPSTDRRIRRRRVLSVGNKGSSSITNDRGAPNREVIALDIAHEPRWKTIVRTENNATTRTELVVAAARSKDLADVQSASRCSRSRRRNGDVALPES